MAGLYSSKPTVSSSPSSSSTSSSSYSRLFLLVTLLSLSLACFAFVLQWRGGFDDPVTHWSIDHHEFPGMVSTQEKRSLRRSVSDSGCVDLLGQSRAPSFPYFRNWKFDYDSDLKPRVSKPFLIQFWVFLNLILLPYIVDSWYFDS